jgi:hypothetical protein
MNRAGDGGLKPGSWYLCATCVTCGEPIPFVEIEEDPPVTGDGTFAPEMPCPWCGAAARPYPVSRMQRIQAKPRGTVQ